jgi:hypothetical protein
MQYPSPDHRNVAVESVAVFPLGKERVAVLGCEDKNPDRVVPLVRDLKGGKCHSIAGSLS